MIQPRPTALLLEGEGAPMELFQRLEELVRIKKMMTFCAFLAYSIGLIASNQITIHELSCTLNIFEIFYPFFLQPSTNAWWLCSRMAEPNNHPPAPCEARPRRRANGCHELWWSSCASFISHSWMNSQSCEVGFDHPGTWSLVPLDGEKHLEIPGRPSKGW